MKKIAVSVLVTISLLSISGIVLVAMDSPIVDSVKEKLSKPEPELYTEPYEIATNANIAKQQAYYIKVSVVLSTTSEDTLQKLNTSKAPVRDILIRFINTHELNVWTNVDTREKIKSDIKTKLEKELNVVLKNIYFTDIVKQ